MMSNPERKDTLSSGAWEMMAEDLCERARNRSVQWMVVAGEGGAFCSGIDLVGDVDGASPAKDLEGELIQRTNTASSAGAHP